MSSLFLRRCSIFPLFEFSFTCHLFSMERKGIFTPTYWNMITSWHKLQSGCKLLHNKTRGNIEYHGKRTSHFMLSLPELLHWSNHASLQHCFPRNILLFLREPFRQRRYVFFTSYAIGLDFSVTQVRFTKGESTLWWLTKLSSASNFLLYGHSGITDNEPFITRHVAVMRNISSFLSYANSSWNFKLFASASSLKNEHKEILKKFRMPF